MPDLSDTVAKCRMGTAKKFYTSIASLSHTNKVPGHEAAHGRRRCGPDWYDSGPSAQWPLWLITILGWAGLILLIRHFGRR